MKAAPKPAGSLSRPAARLLAAALLAAAWAAVAGQLVSPGNSPGCTLDEGNVNLNSGATLRIEIGGPDACMEYDRYTVAQSLTLNGATLEVILLGSYVPEPGTAFDVLDWGSLSGAFGTLNFSAAVLAPGDFWITDALETSGELIVGPLPELVPLPAWALLALGLALAAAGGRGGRSPRRPGPSRARSNRRRHRGR